MVLLTPASGKEVISMPEKEISLAPLPFFNPRRKVLLIIFPDFSFSLPYVCGDFYES